MNTIARKLFIFVLMAAAVPTGLTIGATTTLAVSNTHTQQFQLSWVMMIRDSLAGLAVVTSLANSTLHSMHGVTHITIIAP